MARRQAPIGAPGTASFLGDKDWITVIGALVRDRAPESRRLAKSLLLKSKQGRHVRLVRLIQTRCPRLAQMEQALRVTRRTIFRDLNDLEAYGIRLAIDEDYRYEIVRLPPGFKRLISRLGA